MPTFTYSISDQSGKVTEGEREADNEKNLAEALKSEGFLLLSAKEKGKSKGWNVNINLGAFISRLKPVSLIDKMVFTRNLAVMIGAGLSLTKALGALMEEASSKKFKNVISDINNSIIKGTSFA